MFAIQQQKLDRFVPEVGSYEAMMWHDIITMDTRINVNFKQPNQSITASI